MTDPLLTVLVVDDEAPARALLQAYLADEPEVRVVGEAADGYDAVRAVHELAPDIVLLDIQMPRLDGFEVVELLGKGVAVIFVTAFDEYAVRAFDVHAVDYLLKPIEPERLHEALDRARRRLGTDSTVSATVLAAAAGRATTPAQRVLVRAGPRVHVVPTTELDYAEARDDAIRLVARGREYLKQQTLGDLEATLDPRRFVRIHRSFLLNLDRLARLELYAKDSRLAILVDGTKLPVSRAGYARLRRFL